MILFCASNFNTSAIQILDPDDKAQGKPNFADDVPVLIDPSKQNVNNLLQISNIRSPTSQLGDSILTTPYKVKVTFDFITIHNTHDPGDGEYDLVVYVQGKKVDLTQASINCLYAGVDFPPCGLGDSNLHETIYFNRPGQDTRAEIIVDIPRTIPLSIFTVGHEVDECSRVPFPKNIENFDSILKSSFQDMHSAITNIQKKLNSYDCDSILENDNEILGTIIQSYPPPSRSPEQIGFGAGAHNAVSSTRDFTLRYTISVITQPEPVLEKEGLYITGINPSNGATGIDTSSPVVITFNKPVQKESITQNFHIVFTDPKRTFIFGTRTLSDDGKTFTFTPSKPFYRDSEPLLPCTSYTVKIGSDLKSSTGELLGSEFSSTFITKASSNTNICTNMPPAIKK